MQQIKVLVIEDNPGDERLVREMLGEIKDIVFEAEFVGRLGDALDYLSREHPDLILSDLCLPDSIGIETFLKLHETAKEIPTILLTGEINESYASIALSSGAKDYLMKGQVDVRTLRQSIREATRKKLL